MPKLVVLQFYPSTDNVYGRVFFPPSMRSISMELVLLNMHGNVMTTYNGSTPMAATYNLL